MVTIDRARFRLYRCRTCGQEGNYYHAKGEKFERCRYVNDEGMKCLGPLELVPRSSPGPRAGAQDNEQPSEATRERGPAVTKSRQHPRRPALAYEGEESFPEHPLFPFSNDGETFEVSFIHLTRWENGRQVWGPVLPASELETEAAIMEMFGGGQYVLYARRAMRGDPSKPSGTTKSRKITLPGRPKPFSSDPTLEEEAAYDPAKRAALPQAENGAAHPGAFQGSGGFEQVLLAMMSMQQQTAERAAAENRESARREAENSKAFMTMFLGMMNASKADTANMMQMMMQLSASQQTAMIQLLPALIGARGGGPEEMAKFADLFKALGFVQTSKGGAAPKDDDNSIGAILSNGADILQGFLALKGGMNGAAPPAGEVAPAQAAPGSAAEMLDRMRRGGQ